MYNSWENFYRREIDNHAQDAEDEGTIWFDESGAEEAVVKVLGQLEEDGVVSREQSAVLDLGTGNGHMLFTLRVNEDEGGMAWRRELVGVDYSGVSIELARRIAEERGLEADVVFETWDLLAQSPGDWMKEGGFEVVLDKGTFDAISLMPRVEGEELPGEMYRRVVLGLVKDGGVLVITSCNWTKDEVLGWLASDGRESGGAGFTFWTEAQYPSFSFGGRSGQSIVTVALRKTGARAK